MASVLTAPAAASPDEAPTPNPPSTANDMTKAANAVPARELVHMGKAATVPAGMNWLTLVTVILFHVGALAAFFFFSWGRLAVMAVLYVLAINVGIGMCYHRLLTHRGYQTPDRKST